MVHVLIVESDDETWLSLRQAIIAAGARVTIEGSILTEFADLSETVDARLARLLADPIVRMTMAADNVSENELYELLRRACRKLRAQPSDDPIG